jgi:hypothetical protein
MWSISYGSQFSTLAGMQENLLFPTEFHTSGRPKNLGVPFFSFSLLFAQVPPNSNVSEKGLSDPVHLHIALNNF